MIIKIYCEGKTEELFFKYLINLRYRDKKYKYKFVTLDTKTSYRKIDDYIKKQIEHENKSKKTIVVIDKDNFEDSINPSKKNYYLSDPCFEANLTKTFKITNSSINKCNNIKKSLNEWLKKKHKISYETININKITKIYNEYDKQNNTIEKVMNFIKILEERN